MKNKAWKVVWNEDTFGTYLYGSKIWFHSREYIEFENELMLLELLLRNGILRLLSNEENRTITSNY